MRYGISLLSKWISYLPDPKCVADFIQKQLLLEKHVENKDFSQKRFRTLSCDTGLEKTNESRRDFAFVKMYLFLGDLISFKLTCLKGEHKKKLYSLKTFLSLQ